MSIHVRLLEKWQQYREHRYPVLLIVKAPLDTLLPSTVIEKFAGIIEAKVLNFQDIYQGRLDHFLTWQAVRDDLYAAADSQPVIATELEPLYVKWSVEERLAFLRNLLRSEPRNGIIVTINCQENLSELLAIEENSRGLIWAPSK